MPDSFPDAARRHRQDAKFLTANGRFQNAGHLIGFAAECLAKDVLSRAGIVVDKASGFKTHFPELAQRIKVDGRTRVMSVLTPIVRSAAFLDGWRVESRYAAPLPVNDAKAQFDSWNADVDLLFTTAGHP